MFLSTCLRAREVQAALLANEQNHGIEGTEPLGNIPAKIKCRTSSNTKCNKREMQSLWDTCKYIYIHVYKAVCSQSLNGADTDFSADALGGIRDVWYWVELDWLLSDNDVIRFTDTDNTDDEYRWRRCYRWWYRNDVDVTNDGIQMMGTLQMWCRWWRCHRCWWRRR